MLETGKDMDPQSRESLQTFCIVQFFNQNFPVFFVIVTFLYHFSVYLMVLISF